MCYVHPIDALSVPGGLNVERECLNKVKIDIQTKDLFTVLESSFLM